MGLVGSGLDGVGRSAVMGGVVNLRLKVTHEVGKLTAAA